MIAFRALCAVGIVLFSVAFAGAAARADAPALSGVVADATSSLPVSGASVRIVLQGSAAVRSDVAMTGTNGRFTFANVASGTIRLHIERSGYQPADSEPIAIGNTAIENLTVAIQTAPNATQTLKTVASTSTRATQSLERSSAIYRTLSPETLLQNGVFRFGDALRTLPGVNNGINGDTASLGDDLQLSIRGFGNGNTRTGQIETTATLDGHPIGVGIPGGFNYQLSPTFGLQNITVYYGSAGTGLTGYDAIGGIVDSRTIDPTPDQRITFTQGAGTFARFGTNLTATGTANRLGYAFSLGVSSVDGAFDNQYFYQPGAAYDPSATSPAVRDLAVYRDDSAAVTRDGVFKLRYSLSDSTHLTLTNVDSEYWEDKTGNGDGDYLTPQVALLDGQGLLAKKSAKDTCPAGEFTATNANGTPWGTGPGGVADGGNPCQTPASYAHFVAGLQGAGPAWQEFDFNDEALHFDSSGDRHVIKVDGFTNRYFDTSDRTYQLPFITQPGDAGSWSNSNAGSTGVVASDDLIGRNNDFGFGYEYTNFAYELQRDGSLIGAPIVHETNAFVREAYRPAAGPLALYASADFKHATTTNTSYVDPRVSAVYTLPGDHDVVRAAAGATTAQPPANLLDQLFAPSSLVTAGGGGGINCATTNSVGSAPSSILRPERGVDEEAAYSHRFNGDSQVELSLYNTDVFDKIYSTITPLAITGTSFIDPATLATIENQITAKCGGNALALLGVTGYVNIGQLRARGFTLSGRQRISPGTFFDYDYATTSTVVTSATPQFLQQNLTIVPNAQLPRVPLHTLDFAVDGLITPKIDVRYTLHVVGDNNTKGNTGYNYSDLRISAAGAGPGTVSISVFNLFSQNAFINGYLDEGEALGLNQYAKPSQYAPFVGAGETELFGLPYRSMYFTYTTPVGAHR